MTDNTIQNRFKKMFTFVNMTSSQFADEVGIQRSNVSHILSGRSKPSFDLLSKIATHFEEVNINWLITGEGNISKDFDDSYAQINEDKTTNDISAEIIENINENSLFTNVNKSNIDHTQDDFKEEVHNEKNETSDSEKSITSLSSDINKIVILYEDGTFKQFSERQ